MKKPDPIEVCGPARLALADGPFHASGAGALAQLRADPDTPLPKLGVI